MSNGTMTAVRGCPDRIVLLGVVPDGPETEYGWIEPGELLTVRTAWPVFGVRRFWEKPGPRVAGRLARDGALWNSFVVVAQRATLEGAIRAAGPWLGTAFDAALAASGAAWCPDEALRAVYAAVPSVDMSREVLERRPERLAVLPVSGIAWNDLGAPARMLATQRQLATRAVPA